MNTLVLNLTNGSTIVTQSKFFNMYGLSYVISKYKLFR